MPTLKTIIGGCLLLASCAPLQVNQDSAPCNFHLPEDSPTIILTEDCAYSQITLPF